MSTQRRHHDSPDSDPRVAVVGRALFLGTMTGLAAAALGFAAVGFVDRTESAYAVIAGAVGAVVGLVVGAVLAPLMLWLSGRRAHAAERPATALVARGLS